MDKKSLALVQSAMQLESTSHRRFTETQRLLSEELEVLPEEFKTMVAGKNNVLVDEELQSARENVRAAQTAYMKFYRSLIKFPRGSEDMPEVLRVARLSVAYVNTVNNYLGVLYTKLDEWLAKSTNLD